MELINSEQVQEVLNHLVNKELFIHLETTNGAYASHYDESFFSAGAFLRNAQIRYERGTIIGNGPYRVGLKLPYGWVYAEGITHFNNEDNERLLLAGYDNTGKLAVALQISVTPFS
jgi:hypothetical protein